MVNTFVVADTPEECARLLDKLRLGKQRVEGMQIIDVLTSLENGIKVKNNAYVNHTATKMWSGYIPALKYYVNCMIREWIKRGCVNTMTIYDDEEVSDVMPWWFKTKYLQMSHQMALLKKEYEYYESIFTFTVYEMRDYFLRGYVWPSKLNKEQRRRLRDGVSLPEDFEDQGVGIPSWYRYSRKTINKWRKNKTKNPLTNRTIKEDGPLYREFEKASNYFRENPRKYIVIDLTLVNVFEVK